MGPGTSATVLAMAALAAGCTAGRASMAPPGPPPARADLPATATFAALPGILDVDGAVRLALERNPDLAAARSRIEAALAGIEAARAGRWPRVSVEGSYLRSDAPSLHLFRTVDAHALDPRSDFNRPGSFDDLQAAGEMRWNLFDGGRTRLAIEAAGASGDVARHGAAAVRNALVAGVVASFLDARAAAEAMAADEASVRSVGAGVEEMRTRVEGGAALRSDLLSLEVRLAEAREALLRSDLSRRLALANLRRLLALPAEAPLLPAAAPFGGAGSPPPDLREAVAEAFRNRPEVAAVRRAQDRARAEAEAARRAFLPRLDAGARAWADDGDARGDFGDANWSVGLTLSLDLFDGGARAAGVHRAEAALRGLAEEDRALLHGVATEVEAAWLRLEEARSRHDVTVRAVEAARESFDLVEEQFRGGAATVTRYLEAEAARTRARTNEAGTRIDEERAAAELARALGRLGGPAPDAGREGGSR